MRISEPIIDSVCRALAFIEQNLQGEIAVVDIADAACYSLYHFCRLFNSTTHFTPYEYLMRRRLSEAAKTLVNTRKKIIEIAFEYRFNSPETFGRAFKRMFEILPNQWRMQGQIRTRLLTPEFSREYLRHLHKGEYLQAVLEERGVRHFVGLGSVVGTDPDLISRLWEIFEHELAQTGLKEQQGAYYGIFYYPTDWEERGVFYMAGKEIMSPEFVSPTLFVRTMPALQYARFIHAGSPVERHLTMQYIYHTWLPKSKRHLSFPLELECYGEDFMGALGERAEYQIYIPLKDMLSDNP